MKYSAVVVAALAGFTNAGRIARREVPQEHSHNIYLDIVREFLALDNPKGIQDPVFGLLGDAAAATGAGTVTNLACLKQETADQAFTNAKAIGDIRGMAGALVYQALERNTGKVGLKSAACTDTPVNAEIGAFSQHQDPASDNAAAENKAITLALANQLALIGADPLLALESGTFAPGNLNDATAKGNSCDTDPDNPGCIFSQRLLVLDATPEEISSAVAGVAATFTGTGVISATNIDFNGLSVADATGTVAATTTAAGSAGTTTAAATTAATTATETAAAGTTECAVVSSTTCSVITTTVAATATDSVLATITSASGVTVSAAGVNIQAFTGTLGGTAPAVVSSAGTRPFSVNGDTFVGSGAALGRSCDIQHNACANAANSGTVSGGVAACDQQNNDCKTANSLKLRARRIALERAARRARQAPAKRQATDFGSCTDPTIKFATGLDGRKEAAFAPNNNADFNHGSAQKIGIISSFICQRLSDSCKASADTVSLCNQANDAATAATQDQTAADTFNSILVGGSGSNSGGTTAAATATAADTATATANVVVMTITQCA